MFLRFRINNKPNSIFISGEQVTRWEEIAQTLLFHVSLSRKLAAPSLFCLLNESDHFIVGSGNDGDDGDEEVESFLAIEPSGDTPLCQRIREIAAVINRFSPQLRAAGQFVSVIILTDGEASDGSVLEALNLLINLPVWIVIRLCTNEREIVDYWNEVDTETELNIEVLKDLFDEAKEVHAKNSWLTYCEPLHKMREFGIILKEIDNLDEETLSLDQIRLLCSFM